MIARTVRPLRTLLFAVGLGVASAAMVYMGWTESVPVLTAMGGVFFVLTVLAALASIRDIGRSVWIMFQ